MVKNNWFEDQVAQFRDDEEFQVGVLRLKTEIRRS